MKRKWIFPWGRKDNRVVPVKVIATDAHAPRKIPQSAGLAFMRRPWQSEFAVFARAASVSSTEEAS